MRKNILFVVPSLKMGGAEIFVCNLASCLCQNFNYTVSIYLLGGVCKIQGKSLYEYLCTTKVNVVGVRQRKAITYQNLKEFSNFVSKSNPCIIISTIIQADLAVSFHKLVSMLRFEVPPISVRRVANSPNLFWDKAYEFFCPLFFRDLIFCSHVLKRKRRFYQLWNCILGVRYHIILNGIPFKKRIQLMSIARDRSEAFSQFTKKKRSYSTFSAGRFDGSSLDSMQKGFDILVRSLALRKSIGANIKSHSIYGDGILRQDIIELIRMKQLNDVIDILPPEPIENILRRHDVLIFPSRFEGLSNLVMESLLAGCYVFLSDIPENRVFQCFQSQVSFFDNTAGSLAKVFDLVDTIEVDISSIQDIAESFSMKRCSSKYNELFLALLAA